MTIRFDDGTAPETAPEATAGRAWAGGAWAGRAWVVFRDCASPWWRAFLRPGFGHCLVILPAPAHWLVMDPLSHFTDLGMVSRDHVPDLPARFRAEGMAVVEAPIRRDADTPAPWAPFTCVEAVKRVLGVRDPKIFTPWRLYRALVDAGTEELAP